MKAVSVVVAAARKVHRRSKERPSFVVATLAEVAEFFGVGINAVNDWRGQPEPMPGVNGCYDLSEIVKWKLGRGRQTSGLREELTAADIRLKTAQARAKELDNDIAAGELVERRNVELWLATACIEFREMVMALPERLTMQRTKLRVSHWD